VGERLAAAFVYGQRLSGERSNSRKLLRQLLVVFQSPQQMRAITLIIITMIIALGMRVITTAVGDKTSAVDDAT